MEVQQTKLTLSGGHDSAQQLEKHCWSSNVALASGGPTWRPWMGMQPCAGSGEARCQAGAAPPSRGHPAGQRPLPLCPRPSHPRVSLSLWPSLCLLPSWAPLPAGPRVLLREVAASGRSNCCFLWAGMLCSSSCALSCCCPCVCGPGSVCPGQKLAIWLVPELGSDRCPDGTGFPAEFQEPAF